MRNFLPLAAIYIFATIFGVVGFIAWEARTDPPRTEADITVIGRTNYQYQFDRELGFAPRPNFSDVQVVGKIITPIYTDSTGARIDTPNTPAKQHEIVAVGCSQTFGHGVRNEDTFASIIGNRLGKSVGNYAISGEGGVGSLLMLKRLPKSKIVIYGLWEDHLRRNVSRCVGIPGPVCVELPIIENGYIKLPETDNLFAARDYLIETAHPTFQTDFKWTAYKLWRSIYRQHTATREEKIEAGKLVLTEMKKVSDILIVVYIPIYFQEINPAPRELVELAKAKGFILIDMHKRLSEFRARNVVFTLSDGHLNAVGHQAIADEVVPAIRQSGECSGGSKC